MFRRRRIPWTCAGGQAPAELSGRQSRRLSAAPIERPPVTGRRCRRCRGPRSLRFRKPAIPHRDLVDDAVERRAGGLPADAVAATIVRVERFHRYGAAEAPTVVVTPFTRERRRHPSGRLRVRLEANESVGAEEGSAVPLGVARRRSPSDRRTGGARGRGTRLLGVTVPGANRGPRRARRPRRRWGRARFELARRGR